MSAEDRTQLSSEDRESLTAYLDGELSEKASTEMERTIAIDSSVQREAEMLKRTWDLLDELPRPTLPQNFTTRTLASIQLSELGATQKIQPLKLLKQLFVLLVWLVAFVASTTVGYMVSNRWEKPPQDELIRNLDWIEKMDIFPYVKTPEFLEELQKSHKFDEKPLQPQSP